MTVAARISNPSGGPQGIGVATVTAVVFDTEDYDTHGFADLGTSNTRLTVPSGQDGLYLIGGTARFTNIPNAYVLTGLRKNSTTVQWQSNEVTATQSAANGVTFIDNLAAGDFYELVVFSEDPDVTNAVDGPYLWMTRLDAPEVTTLQGWGMIPIGV